MLDGIRHIAIQWPRFGPYHIARIRGLHDVAQANGARVIALETASGMDERYAWTSASTPEGVCRVDVLPGRAIESVSAHSLFRATYRALNRLQPDVVGINSYAQADAWACLCWCRDHRRVALLMTESKADDVARVGWREWLKRKIVRQFDCGLVGGQAHRAYMNQLGLPSEVIRLGYDVVDNDYYSTAADRARQSGIPVEVDGPFFLCVSQFIPRKNVDGLIRAYARYRTQTARAWPLVILGSGPETSELQGLIAKLNVQDVHMLGTRPPEALPHYYACAGALVHPAHQDQWGLVVNEAMAAGLPVIASDGAGSTLELVEENVTGMIMRAGDEEHLAHLLARMADPASEPAVMGAAARNRVAAWSPALFGQSFWEASLLGHVRANRSMPASLRLALRALVQAVPRLDRFHTVN